MTADEQIPYEYEFVVDAGYAGRISRAIVINFYLRTLTLFLSPALLLIVAVILFTAGQPLVAISLLAVCALLLLVPLLVYRLTWRRLDRAFPVGSVLRSGFAEEAFALAEPASTTTFRYAAFHPPRVRGEFAVLRERLTRQDTFYPIQLFPEEARDRMAASRALN